MKKSITIKIDPALYAALKIESKERGMPYIHILVSGCLAHDNRLYETLKRVQKGAIEWNEEQEKPVETA